MTVSGSFIRDLIIPPADVSAHALGVLLNGPSRPLLARRTVATGDSSLSMGIIGASHMVDVSLPMSDVPVFREEVSCLAACPSNPAAVKVSWCSSPQVVLELEDGNLKFHRSFPAGDYWFSMSTERFTNKSFDSTAEKVVAGFSPDWLVGRFPGEGEFHITALHGRWQDDRWLWLTFHLYPQERTIVQTESMWVPPSQVLDGAS